MPSTDTQRSDAEEALLAAIDSITDRVGDLTRDAETADVPLAPVVAQLRQAHDALVQAGNTLARA